MNKIKKSVSLLLIFIILFSLVGCKKPDILSNIDSKNILNKKAEAETTEANATVITNGTQYTVVESVSQNEVFADNNVTTTASSTTTTQSGNDENSNKANTTSATKPNSTTKPVDKPIEESSKSETVVETGVSNYKSNYNSIEQVIYYPNSIKSSSKKLPVIAWANGTGCSYSLYEKLLISIAEGGYIVIANAETMAADGNAQINSIDFVLSESSNKNSIIYGKVNTDKIAVFGHSQGGRSSVNAAVKDGRIDCVLSLAGSNFLEEAEPLKAPTLFLTGTSDMIVSSSQWVKPAYDVAKGPAVYASLVKGVHTTCCTNPEKYSYYCLKWFDIYLKNDNSAKAIFQNGGELSKDANWTDFACKGI